MTRFIWATAAVAFVALAAAGALVAYTVTSPRDLVGADGQMPAYFVLLTVMRGWLPALLIVGLGAAVCIPFALAVRWNRAHPIR